jgi:hypothetical protein
MQEFVVPRSMPRILLMGGLEEKVGMRGILALFLARIVPSHLVTF